MTGKVIIINGPSAAGKSSIQKKIQELFSEPYIALGIDTLFDQVLPDYYGLGEVHPKGDFSEKDIRYVEEVTVDGKKAIKLFVGPIGRKVVSGMHYSIAAYAKAGNNVVVDYIAYEKEWVEELKKALEGVECFFVGLNYPLEAIEQREAARSTSPVGHARSHYYTVHDGVDYNLSFSDSSASAEEIARQIQSKTQVD